MSDLRLRKLERNTCAGDRSSSSRLLLERVRAGTLSRDRLRLAAYLGDPIAQEIAESAAPLAPDRWLAGLSEFGPEVVARAATAAARLALAGWEAWEAGEFAPGWQLRRAVEAADPESEEAAALLEAAAEVLDDTSHLLAGLEAEHGVRLGGAWVAHRAGLAALAATRAGLAASRGRACPATWTSEVAHALDPDRLKATVREALVPWALSS